MTTQTYQPTPDLKISDRLYRTSLNGLYYLENQIFHDDRGFFTDLANLEEIRQTLGLDFNVKQLNLSRSHQNVVRGMHAEKWNKLVTVVAGTAFCAIADIEVSSPTYGKVEQFMLGKQTPALTGCLFISSGLANSICVLEGPLDYLYAVDELYSNRDTSGDIAINLFDPLLNIQWPISRDQMIISQRDIDSINLTPSN